MGMHSKWRMNVWHWIKACRERIRKACTSGSICTESGERFSSICGVRLESGFCWCFFSHVGCWNFGFTLFTPQTCMQQGASSSLVVEDISEARGVGMLNVTTLSNERALLAYLHKPMLQTVRFQTRQADIIHSLAPAASASCGPKMR
jgi:hypothetical protein